MTKIRIIRTENCGFPAYISMVSNLLLVIRKISGLPQTRLTYSQLIMENYELKTTFQLEKSSKNIINVTGKKKQANYIY